MRFKRFLSFVVCFSMLISINSFCKAASVAETDAANKSLTAQPDGYYTDGKPVGRYLSPKQIVSGKIGINNASADSKSVSAVSAYYENGLLKAVGNIAKATAAPGKSVNIYSDITIPDGVTGGEIKTIVFESDFEILAKTHIKNIKLRKGNIKLYLIGDSICDDSYSLDGYRRGWGGFIGDYFGSEVSVVNHGHSGYTIENFMNGNNWAKHDGQPCSWENIKKELKKGDVVMVSLGINDNAKIEKGEYTWEYYQSSLETIINGAKEKGADIVLVTSTPNYYAYNSTQDSFSGNSYGTPRDKMQEVALKKGVPCFDLNGALKEKLNGLLRLGWTADNIFPARKNDSSGKVEWLTYENGDKIAGIIYSDGTHYTREGSKLIAELIVDYLESSKNRLAAYIEQPEAPSSPAGNLLDDYSFENNLASLRAVDGGKISYDPNISRNGKKSVMFTKSRTKSVLGIGSSDKYLLDLIKKNGVGKYRFEAYVKPGTYFMANDLCAQVSINFINSKGEAVSPSEFEVSCEESPSIASQIEKATKWQKVWVEFNIKDLNQLDNISKIQLCIGAETGKGTFKENQSLWVDDASLCKLDK